MSSSTVPLDVRVAVVKPMKAVTSQRGSDEVGDGCGVAFAGGRGVAAAVGGAVGLGVGAGVGVHAGKSAVADRLGAGAGVATTALTGCEPPPWCSTARPADAAA